MWQTKKEVSYLMPELLNHAGAAVAAVSSRNGGVSNAPFASLNMSFSTGDNPDYIRENRRRFFAALGLSMDNAVCCSQVHGTHIVAVTEADRGKGAYDKETAIPACDGLMTNVPGIVLTMNFADCTPLWVYDPVHQAVALGHGGWRGTAANIGPLMLKAMHEAYGTEAKDVYVAFGPTIRACSFEVGQDVLDAFGECLTDEELAMAAEKVQEGKYFLDLPAIHKTLFLQAGVLPHHMEDVRVCTYCHEELFYSYRKASRRGEKTGRHMALIAIRQ